MSTPLVRLGRLRPGHVLRAWPRSAAAASTARPGLNRHSLVIGVRSCSAASHAAQAPRPTPDDDGSREHAQGALSAASRASRDLRRVLRRVPSPVVVVTTAGADGVMRGITCSSFTSVSLRPPIVSFCITQPSSTADLLTASERCAVHVLSAKQASISQHFAKGAPRDGRSQFEGISHHLDPDTRLPVLHATLGVMFCKKRETLVMGDHMVWVGDVTGVHEGAHGNPLLYYRRSYRTLGEEAFMREFETTTLSFDKWTHVAHVRMAWNYVQEAGGLEAAMPLIRDGIQRYNQANLDKISHGFNETITQFFARMIAHRLEQDAQQGVQVEDSTFSEFLQRHPELADKSFLFSYYTSDRVFADDAKASWTEPDLQPMPDRA